MLALSLVACKASSRAPTSLEGGPVVDAGVAAPAPLRPVDHLDKVARYSGFGQAVTVGTHLVLVGCRKLRVVDDGVAKRDVPVDDARDSGDGDGDGCAAIAGRDEARVFLVAQGKLLAFDAATGSKTWDAGPRLGDARLAISGTSDVHVASGIVAASDDAGHVVGLAASDGHLVWTSPTVERDHRGVLVGSGDLLFRRAGGGHALQALDAKSGRVAWETSTGADDISTVAAGAQVVAMHLRAPRGHLPDVPEDSLVILDARTGAVQHTWPRWPRDYAPLGDLVVADDAIYNDVRSLRRIDLATGAETTVLDGATPPFVFAHDAVFWIGPGSILHANDLATGAPVWAYGIAAEKDPAYGSFSVASVGLIDDPAHPGEQLLVGSVSHASNAPGDQDVVLFRRGDTAVHPRSVRIEGVMRGAARGETVTINGVESPVDAKLHFAATVEARGSVLVEPREGAGIEGAPRSVDVETGAPLYKVGLVVHEFEQTCR